MSFDISIIIALQTLSNPLMNSLMELISFLGNPLFWVIIAALIYWSGKEEESFVLIFLISISSIIAYALKAFFAIPRPTASLEVRQIGNTTASQYSFPSGHLTTISSVLGFYSKKGKKVIITLIISLLLIAISRLYLGAHYLIDLIGGLIIGIIIGLIILRYSPWLKKFGRKVSKQKLVKLLIGITLLSIIALIYSEKFYITGIALGYLAGYFTCTYSRIELRKLISNSKELISRNLFGLTGLILLLWVSTLTIITQIQFITLFLAGLWITYLMPITYKQKKIK